MKHLHVVKSVVNMFDKLTTTVIFGRIICQIEKNNTTLQQGSLVIKWRISKAKKNIYYFGVWYDGVKIFLSDCSD